MYLKSAVKDWAPVIEALGHGKQLVLLRGYSQAHNKLVLYPTYSGRRDIPDKVQESQRALIHDRPASRREEIELRYYADVVKCYHIKADPTALKALKRMYIWTPEHVAKRFAFRLDAYVWLMRVFRLKSSTFTSPLPGMIYAVLKESVSTDCAKSVVSEKDFMSARQYISSCLSNVCLEE